MRRTAVVRVLLFVAPVLCWLPGILAADAPRPNIVIILADDMGFSDLGCYGSEIPTPHLDRLAAGGLRFTQFYNTARCCPTRASLLTGLYAHQAGVGHMMRDKGRPGYRGDLNDRCVTIAEVLRSAGYHTLMAGKWHVTPATLASQRNWPRQRGFERFYGTIHGGGSYYDPVTLTQGNRPIEPETDDYYYTDAISDHAARMIDVYGRKDEPFFLYVAYTSPHWPLHARPADIARFTGIYDKGWDVLRRERHQRMIKMGLVDAAWPLTPRDDKTPPWADAKNKKWQAQRMAVYAAQIYAMDRGIGRIVRQLEAIGALDDTLVLFLADNGGCAEEIRPTWRGLTIPAKTRDGRPVRVGNVPAVAPGPENTYQSYGRPWANASNTPFRRYKHWVHEGGIATPLIAHWPAGLRDPGTQTDQIGHVIDLMATCVDAAGATYPETHDGKKIVPLEGKSLLPILRGERRKGHEAIFWEHEGNRAVRRGKWKLVSKHPGKWELYDLMADRTELNDLAASNPDKVAELSALYAQWAKRCGVLPWNAVRKSKSPQVAWPELPESDGTVMIPAQASPHVPGPRRVKVYIHYPGGRLDRVGPETGLMLSLHNWGGTAGVGTADPKRLAERYNVVAICVDYLQSGRWDAAGPAPYDFGYLQALDALRALYCVADGLDRRDRRFARGRIFACGGSGGGNVTLMVNKLAPRTFACIIDMSGMAKLSDDIAFGLEGGTRLNAGYRRDPSSPRHLTRDAQALRFVGHPRHLATLHKLGNTCKIIVVHGTTDNVCPVADAREMVAKMESAGIDVEPHFVAKSDLDGKVFQDTGHALGDRTRIVFRVADKYLRPNSPDALRRLGPTDFERRDTKVRYRTAAGRYVISYAPGFPVARFVADGSAPSPSRR